MIGILEQNIGASQASGGGTFFDILDLSSYGLFYMYAPFRSQQSATLNTGGAKRPIIIKRSNNSGDWYAIDYDENNTISGSSLARANDTGSGVLLSSILSNVDWDVVRMYNQLEVNYYHSKQLTNVGVMRFASGGVIEQKGGVFVPRWLNTSGFESISSTPKTEFNNGNDISILSVVSLNINEGAGTILSTSLTNSTRVTPIIDRRAVARNGFIVTENGNFFADNLAQNNTDEFFVQVNTINGASKVMKSYIDGVFQNEVAFTGSYTNNNFIIGAGNIIDSSNIDGSWGALLCASQEWDATQVSSITNIIKTQFGL